MFEIRKLTLESEETVLNLVNKYYSEDVFKKWLGIQGDDIDLYNINRIKMHLTQNWCVGAFEKKTNNLVGVTMNIVKEKGKPLFPQLHDLSNSKTALSKHLKEFIDFFDDLAAGSFDLLQTDKLFFTGMATVHEMHRKKGIFNILREKSEFFARTAGCKYIVSTPTNEYLCKSFSKHGYQVLRETNYFDYYTRKNAKIFGNVVNSYVKAQFVYKKV